MEMTSCLSLTAIFLVCVVNARVLNGLSTPNEEEASCADGACGYTFPHANPTVDYNKLGIQVDPTPAVEVPTSTSPVLWSAGSVQAVKSAFLKTQLSPFFSQEANRGHLVLANEYFRAAALQSPFRGDIWANIGLSYHQVEDTCTLQSLIAADLWSLGSHC